MWRWRSGWRCWSFTCGRSRIMKSKKVQGIPKTPIPHGRGSIGVGRGSIGGYALAAAVVLIVFLWAYSPVMHTGFLFDDTKQIFALSSGSSSLWNWIGPVRPVLMATYWFNNQLSQDTTSYH